MSPVPQSPPPQRPPVEVPKTVESTDVPKETEVETKVEVITPKGPLKVGDVVNLTGEVTDIFHLKGIAYVKFVDDDDHAYEFPVAYLQR